MITFALRCEPQGHGFDAWFRSGEDFERQSARGLVTCPACGSANVAKGLMKPAVSYLKSETSQADVARMVQTMQTIARKARETADYVGPKFAEEARKIHYGEAEGRRIYGEASPPEVKSLVEEGIGVMPLPALPEDKN